MTTQVLRRSPKVVAAALILLAANVSQGQSQKPAVASPPDPSGMYTFLQEGEFVQITVEPAAAPAAESVAAKSRTVTGFVSRFGDLESDKGAFLDHFFTKGALAGKDLSFTTKPVHGVWYEFKGKLERGTAKTRAEEGYYVVRGTLKRFSTDANQKTTSQSREVTMKSFPDLDAVGTEPGR